MREPVRPPLPRRPLPPQTALARGQAPVRRTVAQVLAAIDTVLAEHDAAPAVPPVLAACSRFVLWPPAAGGTWPC